MFFNKKNTICITLLNYKKHDEKLLYTKMKKKSIWVTKNKSIWHFFSVDQMIIIRIVDYLLINM